MSAGYKYEWPMDPRFTVFAELEQMIADAEDEEDITDNGGPNDAMRRIMTLKATLAVLERLRSCAYDAVDRMIGSAQVARKQDMERVLTRLGKPSRMTPINRERGTSEVGR